MKTSRNPPASRTRSGGGFLLGMFVGLVIGLGVALGIAFYLHKTPVPFLAPQAKPAEKELTATPPAIAALPQGAQPPQAGEKPKFDFYKILPGTEEPVTEAELR